MRIIQSNEEAASYVHLLLHLPFTNSISQNFGIKNITVNGDSVITTFNGLKCLYVNNNGLQLGNWTLGYGGEYFIVTMWVYYGTMSQWAVFAQEGLSNQKGWRISTWDSYTTQEGIGIGQGSSSTNIKVNTVEIGKWRLLGLVRKGNTWEFYVNGVLKGSQSCSVDFSSGGFYIGKRSDVTGFVGYIRDFRYYMGNDSNYMSNLFNRTKSEYGY